MACRCTQTGVSQIWLTRHSLLTTVFFFFFFSDPKAQASYFDLATRFYLKFLGIRTSLTSKTWLYVQHTLTFERRPLAHSRGWWGFPRGSDSKESAWNAGDPGSIPGLRRSFGEGNGKPLQFSCLENPKDRGAWWATVHEVAKSQTWLSN